MPTVYFISHAYRISDLIDADEELTAEFPERIA